MPFFFVMYIVSLGYVMGLMVKTYVSTIPLHVFSDWRMNANMSKMTNTIAIIKYDTRPHIETAKKFFSHTVEINIKNIGIINIKHTISVIR